MKKLNATTLALIFGVLYALMKIAFGVYLWIDPIGFLEGNFPVPENAAFADLLRDRWIANRNLPLGLCLLGVIILKRHGLAGILLVMGGVVEFFDGFVLFLVVLNDLIRSHTILTLLGAIVLTVLCVLAGLYLIKKAPEATVSAEQSVGAPHAP